MIQQAFEELVNEARNGEVKLIDNGDERVVRVAFNINGNEIENVPTLHIKNKEVFNELLNCYVDTSLKFYNLEKNFNNIKLLLNFLFVNITKNEMNNLEYYVAKYISFINDNKIAIKDGEKNTTLGNLKYMIDKQSYNQETPYCFKSYFEKGDSKYALPRISYGISNGICYIYAIQNKDSKINTDSDYNLEVKQKLRTINSSISKYRNVTPSFVVALSLFMSFLKDNNINKMKIVTPLPIRQKNRDVSLEYKIKFCSMQANLTKDQIEILKKEIIDKKINDDYNSTVKFINCFNRLKLHFDNIFLNDNLDESITLEIVNLITKQEFLKEIVKEKER